MLTQEERDKLVSELAIRPGHEKVRVLIHRLLVDGLGVDSQDIDFEKPVPEVHGRIDALLGRTVLEFKSNLRRERKDAEKELTRYLTDRQNLTGQQYVGLATDGADFIAYFLKHDTVIQVGRCRTDTQASRDLLVWLQSAVAVGEELLPDPHTIMREFGRDSLAAHRALDDLGELWASVEQRPEARLKRELWDQLLSLAYGAKVGDDALFLQHTYLAIIAKAIAWIAMIDAPPSSAEALLHGEAFADRGITGQSESDFFDWILDAQGGPELVMQTAQLVGRFRLRDIRIDILKVLYESLIDPNTRHDLGEYYTPDWLAARMVEAAVDNPLEQRVMDPACGSGTFLFHAVRAVLAAAKASGLPPVQAVKRAIDKVAGIDVHPVAVIFARVTYLLALIPSLREGHPGEVALPVYLGDALQWNLTQPQTSSAQMDLLADDETLDIFVPGMTVSEPKSKKLNPVTLRFPAVVAADAQRFDRVLNNMIGSGQPEEPLEHFQAWLAKEMSVSNRDARVLKKTYKDLRRLQKEGRNHIWGYVARNLARPVWLASDAQKADVVIGNPPWVSSRYMSGDFKERFRNESQAANLWVGGKVATSQDLSGYFYLRAARLYMRRPTGRMAMIIPYAAMSRQAYARFRAGEVSYLNQLVFRLRFTQAWVFGPEVKPLFLVPSCVLFAEVHTGKNTPELPAQVRSFSGELPRRDADRVEADARLTGVLTPWPTIVSSEQDGSPYRKAFRQGATLVPRRFVLVEPVSSSGTLPPNPAFPLVRGRTGPQDKTPWKTLPPPEGTIEQAFLRPVLLGESVAPFRVLTQQLAIIPWDQERDQLMDAAQAGRRGYRRLSQWLRKSEALWEQHKKSGDLTFIGRQDYQRGLSNQFPVAPIRVVYAASGRNPAACIVQDKDAVVEHKLYWAAVRNLKEARYLCAILNSEVIRARVAPHQSQGQWGERDFDKYVFNLPIPRFDKHNTLHRELAKAAKTAEDITRSVPRKEGEYFVSTRKHVRAALVEHGVAGEMEQLTTQLLNSAAV